MGEHFTDDELDVLLYIASYEASRQTSPTREEVLAKGLEPRVVDSLLQRGYLEERGGRLSVVREAFEAALSNDPT